MRFGGVISNTYASHLVTVLSRVKTTLNSAVIRETGNSRRAVTAVRTEIDSYVGFLVLLSATEMESIRRGVGENQKNGVLDIDYIGEIENSVRNQVNSQAPV